MDNLETKLVDEAVNQLIKAQDIETDALIVIYTKHRDDDGEDELVGSAQVHGNRGNIIKLLEGFFSNNNEMVEVFQDAIDYHKRIERNKMLLPMLEAAKSIANDLIEAEEDPEVRAKMRKSLDEALKK